MDEAGVSGANVFALNEPDREPAYRAPNDRVLALGRRGAGSPLPVRPPEPRRGPARRGRALPRAGRARHQAAPAGAGLPRRRSLAGGGLRPGGRAAPAGAHPCRPRPASGHAVAARPRGRAAPQRLADPRARGDRGAGRHRRAGAQRREHLLRQLDLVAARPAQPALAGAAGAAPVGLGHPLWRAARGTQRVRPRGARERRRRRAAAGHAGGECARPARGTPAGAPLGAARAGAVLHLLRARASEPVHVRGDDVDVARHARARRLPGPRRGGPARGGSRGAGRARALHGGPVGTSGQRRSSPARRPTSSAAGACSGCSMRRRRIRCWHERDHAPAQRPHASTPAPRRARPWRSSCASRSA